MQGQSALVTGGSQGLVRALGGALASAGARVVLVARHFEPLAAAVAEIRAAGGEAHAIVADVADKDAAAVIAGQAAALVGPIDLLINNASTLGPVPLRLLLDTDCEDLERALAVNLVGAFRLTKAIAGPMVLRGAGTIVNVTSDAATEAYERWGAYGASKAAVISLAKNLSVETELTGPPTAGSCGAGTTRSTTTRAGSRLSTTSAGRPSRSARERSGLSSSRFGTT